MAETGILSFLGDDIAEKYTVAAMFTSPLLIPFSALILVVIALCLCIGLCIGLLALLMPQSRIFGQSEG
jgi:predicted lysophospholipase L1 biosynthesis ABC-type transport system permease subunit